MVDWPTRSVEKSLERLRLGSVKKLQTTDYRPTGRFPIIDQGQALIAGWTDDDSGLINEGLPVVVFGDHTRTLKYVDFPFVRGADGTQVLKPTSDIDPLFFYYALQSLNLPSRGYNRHFKALKERCIGIPSDSEQNGIARSLRLVEDALKLQDQQILSWQTCKRAAMKALFTNGLRSEAQQETAIGLAPESWQVLPISSLGQVITGNTPPTKDRSNYEGGEIPFVSPGDIAHGSKIQATEKAITRAGLKVARPITGGSTCFVCIGSTIGKVGFSEYPICATNQQINSITPGEEFDPHYVFYLMTFWADYIRTQASPSPVPILSKGGFERIDILTTTDPDEQVEIATILGLIDRKIDLHRRKRDLLDAVFSSLLHRIFEGEITVANLDLSALRVHGVEDLHA